MEQGIIEKLKTFSSVVSKDPILDRYAGVFFDKDFSCMVGTDTSCLAILPSEIPEEYANIVVNVQTLEVTKYRFPQYREISEAAKSEIVQGMITKKNFKDVKKFLKGFKGNDKKSYQTGERQYVKLLTRYYDPKVLLNMLTFFEKNGELDIVIREYKLSHLSLEAKNGIRVVIASCFLNEDYKQTINIADVIPSIIC